MNKTETLQSIHREISEKFLKWAEKEIGSLFYFNDEIIYHYTDVAGLKGIIENNCLWATNLSYVNDSRELALGINTYRDVCKKLLEKEKKNKLFKKIVSSFLDCLNQKYISNRYACAFTSNGDQLSQWRGYGLNGLGYAIGFESEELIKNLTPQADPSRVIYDVEAQVKYVEKHITDLVSGFLKRLPEERISKKQTINKIVKVLEEETEWSVLSFKHKGFEEESESRLHLAYENIDRVLVMEKKGILVPYVELRAKNKKKLPIRKITIGPTADFDRAWKGVSFLLEKNGFKGVEVSKSQIPFKG